MASGVVARTWWYTDALDWMAAIAPLAVVLLFLGGAPHAARMVALAAELPIGGFYRLGFGSDALRLWPPSRSRQPPAASGNKFTRLTQHRSTIPEQNHASPSTPTSSIRHLGTRYLPSPLVTFTHDRPVGRGVSCTNYSPPANSSSSTPQSASASASDWPPN